MTADLPAVRVHAPTELRNPDTEDLDQLSTYEVLQLINREDARVPGAVAEALPAVADAVDLAAGALRAGRRVHYFGAGTSGRLGVIDAAELPPTFSTPAEWVCPHLAGGPDALWHAVEAVEDDRTAGAREAAGCVRDGDVVMGIAASGRTPYVLGALDAARAAGAATVLLACDPMAEAGRRVDVFIAVDTGPEVVTGSTRMKAATAQKLVLNAFSTTVMVRMGRVYSNLMVSVAGTNAKLRGRMLSILAEATGAPEATCRTALLDSGGDLKAALVSLLTGSEVADARAALARVDDRVREAIALLAA